MILRGLDSRNGLIRVLSFGLWLLVANGLNAQPQQTEHAPTGWFLAGDNPTNYRIGVDHGDMHRGWRAHIWLHWRRAMGLGP